MSRNKTASQNATPAAEWTKIADLSPWDRNPRRNDEAAKEVAKSIIRSGWGAVVIARRDGRQVIAGHTRLKAAALLPDLWRRASIDERATWSDDARALAVAEHPVVPVRFVDLDEAQAHALALSDNKTGELAEWDDDALAEILRDLEADGVALEGLGWTDDELAAIMDPERWLPPDGKPAGDNGVEEVVIEIRCSPVNRGPIEKAIREAVNSYEGVTINVA